MVQFQFKDKRLGNWINLQRTAELMKQGARGIVYGRNVIQHSNPKAMTQALMAIVHDGADPNQALIMLKG